MSYWRLTANIQISSPRPKRKNYDMTDKHDTTPSGQQTSAVNPPVLPSNTAEARILGASKACQKSTMMVATVEKAEQPSSREDASSGGECQELVESTGNLTITTKEVVPTKVVLGGGEDSRELRESTEDTQPPRAQKTKLSGAARKRLKRLLAEGMEYEEARTKALQSANPTTPAKKRPRSDGNTPDNTPAKRARNPVEQSAKREVSPKVGAATYSQVASVTRMAVLLESFPEDLLTTAQLDQVKQAIRNEIWKGTHEGGPPSFQDCLYRTGYLVFLCKDQVTTDWMRSTIPNISPWEGARLRVEDEANVPKGKILQALLPNSSNLGDEELLKAIAVQNPTMRAHTWRQLGREARGNASLLTVSVDHDCAKKMSEKGMELNFEFGQVRFHATHARKADSRNIKPPTKDCQSAPADKSSLNAGSKANKPLEIAGPSKSFDSRKQAKTGSGAQKPSGTAGLDRQSTVSRRGEKVELASTKNKVGRGKNTPSVAYKDRLYGRLEKGEIPSTSNTGKRTTVGKTGNTNAPTTVEPGSSKGNGSTATSTSRKGD